MIIMKFGGTSVQDKEAIERVISIVESRLEERPVVVVSALAKVTRLLVSIAEQAEKGQTEEAESLLSQLRARHRGLATELLQSSTELLKATLKDIDTRCQALSEFVRGISLIRELSDRSRAHIVSCGELLSSTIVSTALNARGLSCQLLDAREMVKTDENYLAAGVNLADTQGSAMKLITEAFDAGPKVVLTQGFIASTAEGDTSLLGFEGSDYSAALFGLAIGAKRVEIWTDVDGIRSADPRIVSHTSRIEQVSYEEAAAMARLGAKVLHPKTMGPSRIGGVPIQVLNSHDPSGKGTIVSHEDKAPKGPKSLAYLPQIDLVELCGPLPELMKALFDSKIEPLILAQSETGLILTFETETADRALEQLRSTLSEDQMIVSEDYSQFSIIGKDLLQGGIVQKILNSIPLVRLFVSSSDGLALTFVVSRTSAPQTVIKVHELLFGE